MIPHEESRPPVVLVVDDEEDIRELLRYALEQAGFRVLLSRQGQEALDLIKHRSGKVDLVLSDVMMPVVDGPALARRLARHWPKLPLLFMTGYPAEMLASADILPPGIPRIEKPFSMSHLIRKVRSTITGSSS